jgi:hypothetical protein
MTVSFLKRKKKNRPLRFAASVSEGNRRNRQQEGVASHEGVTIDRKTDFSTAELQFPAKFSDFAGIELVSVTTLRISPGYSSSRESVQGIDRGVLN